MSAAYTVGSERLCAALAIATIPLACSRRQQETKVAPDPIDAASIDTGVVADAKPDGAPPSYPVTEQVAWKLVARSRPTNSKHPANEVPRMLLYSAPPRACRPTDTTCGWTIGYGTEPILPNPSFYIRYQKGTCFVHAFTGDATCTANGKKPEPIGNALPAMDAGSD